MYIISWPEVSLLILTFSFSFFLFDYCRTEVLGHSVLKFKDGEGEKKRREGRKEEEEKGERKRETRKENGKALFLHLNILCYSYFT